MMIQIDFKALAAALSSRAKIEDELKNKDKPVVVKPRVKCETGSIQEAPEHIDKKQYDSSVYISQQETLNLLGIMDILFQRVKDTHCFDTKAERTSLTSLWRAEYIARMTVNMARDFSRSQSPYKSDSGIYREDSRKIFSAISENPQNELTGPYAYAIRDLALITENREKMDRLNIDRELSEEEKIKLAERFLRQGFQKYARAQATAHLKSFKGPKKQK